MANEQKGKRELPKLPLDKDAKPLSAVLLPIVSGGVITGYIPLAYEEDVSGNAILHVKVIP